MVKYFWVDSWSLLWHDKLFIPIKDAESDFLYTLELGYIIFA